MKKVLRILFDTAWGAPALLAFVLVLGDLRFIFAAPLSHCGTLCFLLDVSLEVLPVVAGFILLVAFVLSLVRRNWQGLKMLGLVLAVLFGLGALRVPVMLAHERVSQHFSGNAQGRLGVCPLFPPYLQPGFIIAHPEIGDHGHVAIVDYDGQGIGAGFSGTVNKKNESMLDGTSGLRRYVP